jgi:hypothetical protein
MSAHSEATSCSEAPTVQQVLTEGVGLSSLGGRPYAGYWCLDQICARLLGKRGLGDGSYTAALGKVPFGRADRIGTSSARPPPIASGPDCPNSTDITVPTAAVSGGLGHRVGHR